MKGNLPIGFLLALLLSACTLSIKPPEQSGSVEGPSPALSAIDSLMWQQPDSALACLLPYFDTCCRDISRNVSTTYDWRYAHLLLAELLYKNDYTQTNRRELLQSVGYYDSLCCRDVSGNVSTLAFLDARAHYINGVGYYENDSMVEACKEYLKALEVMEDHFKEKELSGMKARFMALTYTHLTDLFSDNYLHEQVIYYGKKSLFYFNKYESETWHIAWILNVIGSQYNMIDELDSANYYYQKAANMLDDTNSILYRDIASHQVILQYRYDTGHADATILKLRQLLAQSENDRERLARSLNIGEIFFLESQLDSAWHYLNTVSHHSSNIAAKKQAAEWLVSICKTQKREAEIIEYAESLIPFANQEENNSELKSQLTELSNIFRQWKMEQEHHAETKRIVKSAILAIIGCLLVILTILFFYHRNKQHKQNLETQIEAERQAHKVQQAALAGRLKRSNDALKKQEKAKNQIAIPMQNSRVQKRSDVFSDESICQHILALCNDRSQPIKSTVPVSAYADIALKDSQIAQLKDAAYCHYGVFFENLKHQFPLLKEKDFLYCYLSLLGLDNAQIAALLQKSISTIWDRENRLKKIFNSDNKIAITLHELIINSESGC